MTVTRRDAPVGDIGPSTARSLGPPFPRSLRLLPPTPSPPTPVTALPPAVSGVLLPPALPRDTPQTPILGRPELTQGAGAPTGREPSS